MPRDFEDIGGRAFDLGMRRGRLDTLIQTRRARNASTGPSSDILVASARPVDTTDPKEAERYKRRHGSLGYKWQAEAWDYFDVLTEIKFGARFKARSLGKLRIFPAFIADADNDPVPVGHADASDVSPQLAAACQDVVDRIDQGASMPVLLAQWGYCGFIPGEAWLLGYADPLRGEMFDLVSSEQLRVNSRNKWCRVDEPSNNESDWEQLPDDLMMTRIWNRHPRYSGLPDSSLRGVLNLCEQLLLYEALTMGIGRSRMHNGFWLFPDGVLRVQGDEDEEDDEVQGGDIFRRPSIQDVMRYFETGIRDPRSAAAAIGFLMSVDEEVIDKIKHLNAERPFDVTIDARMDATIKRLANGVDLPAEVLLGIAESNHWTAWLIDDQTFRSFLEPDAQEWCRAVTEGFFRPELRARGITDESVLNQLTLWYNEQDLVADPDETDRVFKAHDPTHILISDDAARRRLGISETEAPDEAEYLRRVMANKRSATEQDEQKAVGADATLPAAEGTAAPADVTASASTQRAQFVSTLGARWLQRDRVLRARLLTAGDVTMRRALERAGAKLRTKAVRASAAHAEVVHAVPNWQVAAQLGPGVVASLGFEDDDLLDGSFDDFGDRYDDQVQRTQRQTRLDLIRLGLSAQDAVELERQQDDDRSRGREVLVASLVTLALARMFNPTPRAPEIGEHDTMLTVPAGLVRQALSTAGGATGQPMPGGAIRHSDDSVAGGVATGDTVRGLLPQLGLRIAGEVWVYGDPGDRVTNFGPHEDLDGVPYYSAEDEALGNPDAFPDTAYYYQGDHDGCQCDGEPIIEEV